MVQENQTRESQQPEGTVSGEARPVVSVVRCETYELGQIRAALQTIMAPLGGMRRFRRRFI